MINMYNAMVATIADSFGANDDKIRAKALTMKTIKNDIIKYVFCITLPSSQYFVASNDSVIKNLSYFFKNMASSNDLQLIIIKWHSN